MELNVTWMGTESKLMGLEFRERGEPNKGKLENGCRLDHWVRH